jgi:transcriptional regulator with XRE-family HTH domain
LKFLRANVKEKVKIMNTQQYLNFGDFLQKKRTERQITLRKMAEMIGITAPYLTDIEKDRRNPPEMEKLETISNILILSDEEKTTMFDLAGKRRNSVAPDLPDYIMKRDYVSAALRTARDLDAGEEDWHKFVEELKQRKG